MLICYTINPILIDIMTTTTLTNTDINTNISIKSFKFPRTYHRTTGIYSSRQNQNRAINEKVAFICLYFVQFLIATIAFLLLKAESINDLAFAYLVSLSVMFCLVHSFWLDRAAAAAIRFHCTYNGHMCMNLIVIQHVKINKCK